jgi:hypothetical protein
MRISRWLWTCALLVAAPGAVGCEAKRGDQTMHSKDPEAGTEPQRIQQTAIAYAEKLGWRPDEYRIDPRPNRPDGKRVVHLMYLEDERKAVPGGGKSVELFLDPTTLEVVEVYKFQ